MRLASACVSLLLSLSVAAAPEPGSSRLTWIPSGSDATPWSVELPSKEAEPAAAGTPLEAPAWFEPLPEISIPLLAGGSLSLAQAQGSVLLLDFWASWCAPCMQELPRLQELYLAEKPRGLAVIAINVDEPVETARRTAASLRLTVPVGAWSLAVGEVFHPRQLPLLLLADRRGRIRDRWDGWLPGLEKTVASRVRELLEEDPAGPRRVLGEVVTGAGRLRVDWARDLGGTVSGVAAIPVPGETTRIAVKAGPELAIFEPGGRNARSLRSTSAAGRLAAADLDGNGQPELVGFRPGSKELAISDPWTGKTTSFAAPAPVLDVAVLDASPPARSEGVLVLAAADGLYLADREGKRIRRVEGMGETLAVRPAGKGAAARLVALGADGTIRSLDLEGRIDRTAPAPSGHARLAAGEDPGSGFGTASRAVSAMAVGRFLPGGGTQVALAADGSLTLVDLSKREIVWRARWPGIVDLAVADLDRDGRDDLVVAARQSVAVLRAKR